MESVSPARSLVTMTELVLPQHMNALGTAFGGVIVSWIDIVGSICASRHCTRNVVTASIDDVHFYHPVYKGDVVSLKARLNYVHKTSMEVEVRVQAESLNHRGLRHTVAAYMTLVAVDEDLKPVRVPLLDLKTEEEKTRFREAEQRRKIRLERRKHFRKDFTSPSV